MNKLKRLVVQVVLWLAIGIIIWLYQEKPTEALKENLVILFFQFFLISSLIFYASSNFLQKKKYVVFSVFSIMLLFFSAWVLSSVYPMITVRPHHVNLPEFGPPPPPRMKRPPSHFLLHTLILIITYTSSTIIEVFNYLIKREKEVILAKNANLQNELKLLKSQINPHFLFNALNNIYALSTIDSNKTQQSISYLSDMLRYVLYECENELVPIKKEIEYIENYLKLFALKSSKTYPIKTKFHIENNLTIAPMLFIPFIENALKHGNIEKMKESFININIVTKKNNIIFEVENSIPKTDINKDDMGGIGIENVKKRLAILYPQKHNLLISQNKHSFKVQLNLDLT
ncbi:sensor histidine kinase [Seonamhaeicola sp. ML3]|uniref:sensor histidine kinase n=1 Tax=Seonamhaeicola sp. ML3 TaxID=2937786 RepID=UPI00200EAA42|nr:histidine kinase [Seonamhaeicola sp. ML3]